MSEEALITPTEEVIETIPAPEPAQPELPEQQHRYQPTDDQGRPMGGVQVIKYRTHEELVQKLQEQNVHILRKLREQTRNNRLGVNFQEEIPQEAPRMKDPIEFKPRTLTSEEKVLVARDLLDPDRFEQASELLFEAQLGAKPQAIREVLTDVQNKYSRLQAKQESEAFMAANPDYFRCNENAEAITNWMLRYNLEPVRENFQAAFNTLKAAGVLVEKSQPEPVAEPVVVPAAQPVPQPEPPPRRPVAGISSGLTSEQSSNVGTPPTPGSDIVYEVVDGAGNKRVLRGLAAIDAMPSDEYKRRMKDPNFIKKYDKLHADAANKRRA